MAKLHFIMRWLPFLRRCLVASVLAISGYASQAFAVEPDERLADAKLERRARDISANLRCLVCQNQSIDDSNAPLAHDLRVLVREHLQACENDSEIERFLVARYGEFVLLRPRLGVQTALLWFSPFVLLLLVVFSVWRSSRRGVSTSATPPSLSDEEQQRLAGILADRNDG